MSDHGARTIARLAGGLLSMVVAITTAETGARAERLDCPTASEQGQRVRDEGHYLSARELFRQCSNQSCPGIVKRDCARWLRALEDAMPSVVLSVRDAQGVDVSQASVALDGQRLANALDGKPIDVDPGPHVLRFDVPGYEPVDANVTIKVGEKNRSIDLHLKSAARGGAVERDGSPGLLARTPPISIAMAGVALLAFGSFAYFGISGQNDLDHLRATCAPYCAQSALNNAKLKLTVADISLATSLVALGVGAYFLLTAPRTSPNAGSVRLEVHPTVGGAAAGFATSF